ncbi:MAG: peptidoglycan DD-metalloendopeptidase family protein [Ignavibacteriae bacterium]|nr:peptidoglycan DD-metalloendopeptidase family protein [Ignavibacteriota bacterium]
MKRKFKYYFYSPEQLGLKEIRWFRSKVIGGISVAVVLFLIFLLGADYYVFDFLGFSHERAAQLSIENKMLQEKLLTMKLQVEELQKSLEKIDSQGNELRLKVNLSPLNDDMKLGGTGGSLQYSNDGVTTSAFDDVLNSTFTMLEKISGEVKVQQESYAEILRKQQSNQEFFRHLPALLPMVGNYERGDFGMRKHPVLGVTKFHEGVDIINDIGTPVYAPADGVVEFAGHSGGGYGLILLIKHGYGYETLYGHLSKTIVKEGQRIKRGDLIAKSGNSGLVSGPHLHYEVHYNGVRQNPLDYFFNDLTPQQYNKQIASK